MRIATWNLERPRASQLQKLDGIQRTMRAVDADVWILTETNSCVSPGSDYNCLASRAISGPERYAPGENRTTIWSRFPIEDSVETHDPETAVCAAIEHAGKAILIFGTIIPYHAAGTRYPYRFCGSIVAGRKAWELHYESLRHHEADWRRLREEFPAGALCVAGDFNQNRDGQRWYGTANGRKQLGLALAGLNLVCVTEGNIAPIHGGVLNPTIDHICLDGDLAAHVTAVRGWPPGQTPDGRRLSDHTGILVDLAGA